MSDTFNSHFSTIAPNLANSMPTKSGLPHLNYLTRTNKTFQLVTSYSKVLTLLRKLNKTKATGLDKIPARLLMDYSDLIDTSLCSIFNQSITFGIFPEGSARIQITIDQFLLLSS